MGFDLSASRLDHLIFGAPTLEQGVALVEERCGVRAAFGGQHPGKGTHNALLSLGPGVYLEIMAPDPEQPAPTDHPRWLGIDELDRPRMLTWSAKGERLTDLAQRAAQRGIDLGAIADGGRDRPDGTSLRWQLSDPFATRQGGVLPFFIDWGSSPHPGDSAPAGLQLIEFRAEHPDPDRVRTQLRHLDCVIDVQRGPDPALVAVLEGPGGRLELR